LETGWNAPFPIVGRAFRGLHRHDTVDDLFEKAAKLRRARDVDRKEEYTQQPRRHSAAFAATVDAALRHDRLLFAFQPVVCATTGKVDYFECLLRMREENGEIVAGGDFIATVEHLGLIGVVDRVVLEKAVQELDTHPQVKLGFNVSGLTACDRPWLRAFMSVLRSRPELARRIIVEITETAALYDIEETIRFVDTLRHAGCRVALDDFGAGHTTLRHLQTLAVDTVKIDGSFIQNFANSPENRILLRHLLALTNGFGLRTVAECVESAEDAELLRAEGIAYLQGYHIGPPTIERPWLTNTAARVREQSKITDCDSSGAGCAPRGRPRSCDDWREAPRRSSKGTDRGV
jgi:EAL domain-containing protein (putative c-di-GMP-specific phosphodiesterase class I)